MRTDGPCGGDPIEDDEPRSTDLIRAVLERWPVWIVAAVAFASTLYLHLNEGLVPGYEAERFYAILFAAVTVLSVGYGALRVRGEMRT